MRLMRNNKGQFYLVAAVILVIIISAMISITNYSSNKEEGKDIERRSQELKIEAAKVLDYGSANSQNKIDNFTEEYSRFLGEEIEIYYIYSEDSSVEAYTYEKGARIDLSSSTSINGKDLIFNLDNNDYQFNLNKGKNFYFVMIKDTGGEKYVYTN